VRREGVGGDLVIGERVQPSTYRPHPSGVHVAVPVPRDQVHSFGGVPAGQCVTHRVADYPPGPVPCARPLMEGRYYLRLGLVELSLKYLRE
jgi:hypothetical protein